MNQIRVEDLAPLLAQANPPVQCLDVRELEEISWVALPHFRPYPLSQFAQWSSTLLQELDKQAETLVLCHHGIRSAQMCQWLIDQGFTNVKNIAGGIDAYALKVDPTIGRY